MIFQLNLIAHHTDDNYDYQQLHCEVSKIVSESNERVIHWVIQSNFHMINNMFTIANIEPWIFFFFSRYVGDDDHVMMSLEDNLTDHVFIMKHCVHVHVYHDGKCLNIKY